MKPKKPMSKAQPKKASKVKPSTIVKTYLPNDIHKKFMAKVENQGMHGSQWIRHQIMKWVK